MKDIKRVFIIGAVFLMIAFSILLSACDFQSENIAEEVVRIHIRANSNSDDDQNVKLKVRDTLTNYLTDVLKDCTCKSEALALLTTESETIKQLADLTLKQCGFDYTTAVFVKNDYFPQKEYGDYTFPEGYYDALIVLLGDGVGDNWWCVAYPPLCFVPDGENVVYKSWVKEKLDEIFSKK